MGTMPMTGRRMSNEEADARQSGLHVTAPDTRRSRPPVIDVDAIRAELMLRGKLGPSERLERERAAGHGWAEKVTAATIIKLPEKQFLVFLWYYWGNLSQAAIAEKMGIEPASVRQQLWLARKRLAAIANGESFLVRDGHTAKARRSGAYKTWASMRQRCLDPRQKSYRNYGGRGITICVRWQGQKGFENFLEDMGDRPEGMGVERIDNEKGYCPENCKWATPAEQSRNKRPRKRLHDSRADVGAGILLDAN
jgi:hypothetical protein